MSLPTECKKYKLHSASSDNPGICAFFLSEKGCRNGNNCKFLHTLSANKNIESTVSSESEGDDSVKQKPAKGTATMQNRTPISNSYASLADPKPNSTNDKKSKRKKPSGNDPFSNPPTKIAKKDIAPESTIKQETLSIKKSRKAESPPTIGRDTTKNRKQSKDSKVSSAPAPSAKDILNKLNLPVAAFSLPGGNKTNKKRGEPSQQQSVTDSEGELEAEKSELPQADQLPLPTGDEGKRWIECIETTRNHPRFKTNYDLDRYKAQDIEIGYASNMWVDTPTKDEASKVSLPQSIAIDCEMCETQDPVSGKKDYRALCRVSIVDAVTHDVLLDTLVKPTWPVSDYRTRINGIVQENLENVQFTLRHAQAFLVALCSPETVVIGQGLNNDLAALRWNHPTFVDSAFLFRTEEPGDGVFGLRDLSRCLLKETMPDTHDSVNDAIVALRCCEFYRENKHAIPVITRTPRPDSDPNRPPIGTKLMVHRIPKHVTTEHICSMLERYTYVVPESVEPLEMARDGNTQKTYVIFKSVQHASLAFRTLSGKAEEDATGRPQKNVHLRDGSYVRVRSMVSSRNREQREASS